MTNSLTGAFKARPWAWHELFGVGVAGLAVMIYKAWPGSSSPAYYPPSQPVSPSSRSPVVAPAPAAKTLPLPMPVSPVQTVAPVSSFTPSRIAPALLPPSLSDIAMPPKDPAPVETPNGEQPGYSIPERPRPREIR